MVFKPVTIFFLDPCLPSGATHSQDGVEFIGTGNYTACFSSLRPLLHKDTCSVLDQTCSLNGHFQPSFDSVSEFFGFSEFFYTSEDCLHLAGRWNFDLFRKEAESYCATKWSKLEENWKADKYKADANRLKNQCFKSAWVPVSFIDAKYWCFECNRCISRWFSTMVSTFLLIIKS